jgi:putative ABC transport system permease protein
VLKAIGFRDFAIKRLYLTKYLGLSIIGGIVGFIIGIQLSELMSIKLSQYIIRPDGVMGILISMISVMAMILVTLLFCLLCMHKINKASAIDAIRQGHTGERFEASRKIHLHHSKYLSPALFLAFSDVINKLKSYSVLIVTFIISVAIIITPINLMNTIVTPKFINYLGVIEADFYTKSEVANKPVTEIRKELSKLNQEMHNTNFKITLTVDYSFNAKYISDNGKDNIRISGMKSEPATTFHYLEGEAPKLTNEIAITSIMSQKYDKHIGDYITFEIDNKKDRFLITGLVQTITNEGNMIRVGDAYSPVNATSYLFAGKINVPEPEKAQVLEALQQQLPELDLKSATDLLGEITGGFMGQLKSIIYLLTASVCLITFFITSLFVRLLIAKEVRSIAVMKSLGFKNGVIQRWQVLRISILLLGSIIIGVFTANVLGEWVIGFVFQMFGVTKMSFNIVPQQVYLLFPLLILLVVLLAVYSSCGQIKKVQVWEMKQE